MKWQKLNIEIPNPKDTVYILPCEKGVTILCNQEMCILEGISVQECCDEFKQYNNILNIKETVDVIERKKQNGIVWFNKKRGN